MGVCIGVSLGLKEDCRVDDAELRSIVAKQAEQAAELNQKLDGILAQIRRQRELAADVEITDFSDAECEVDDSEDIFVFAAADGNGTVQRRALGNPLSVECADATF